VPARLLALLVTLACAVGATAVARSPETDRVPPAIGEWPSYGADLASTKYSPLAQIDRTNFRDLKLAWRWKSADRFLSRTTAGGSEWWSRSEHIFDQLLEENPRRWRLERGAPIPPPIGNMKVTPLMVGGVLYLNTALSTGVALDAASGELLWILNPKSYEVGTSPMQMLFNVRGVAYWSDGQARRIFWGTADARLICADAKTGRPCEGFGKNGEVDLYDGLPRGNRQERDHLNAMLLSVSSPPLVVRNTVVVGSAISDHRVTEKAVPGWVRAYDAVTGKLKWVFKTIPEPGEFGAETWQNDSWKYSGNTNVWTMMSADEELGHVYLPVSTGTNDYYGGHRPGDNLFAESLVCVDVETGKRLWHFQTVHHGLWDYDLPAAPNLLDVTVDGKPIKAVAQISKQGFVYAFDRVTGTPIWPIEERPVPVDTNLEGEVPSRTQPFPTRPPAFEYQGVTIDDLVDFTPEIRRMAVDAVRDFKTGPLFTPPIRAEAGGLKGTIFRPGTGGGGNWYGAGVDVETGVLYVPSRNAFSVISYYSPHQSGGTLRYARIATPEAENGPGGGTYRPTMPEGLPLFKPPYSRMTAIDMNTGQLLWTVPTGNGDRIRTHPRLRDLDLPPLGGAGSRAGPLVTKTLLIYPLNADGDRAPRLVAYDKATGRELASVDLPAEPLGTPMTYFVNGKQYVALAVGGVAPELVAFALP
jgi:quinoprotein glucose dehydrogenase